MSTLSAKMMLGPALSQLNQAIESKEKKSLILQNNIGYQP